MKTTRAASPSFTSRYTSSSYPGQILHISTPAAFSFWFCHNYEKGLWTKNEIFHQIIPDFQLYLEVCINVALLMAFFHNYHLSEQKHHWASTILCHLCTSRRLPAVAGAGCCCCWCRSCWRSRGAGPGAPRSWRRAPGSRTSPGCILAPGHLWLVTIVPVCDWAGGVTGNANAAHWPAQGPARHTDCVCT